MKFYSTGKTSEKADFKTAVLQGLAPDGGLYMPDILPKQPASFWLGLQKESLQGIAFKIFNLLLKDDFSEKELKEIVDRAFTFEAPIVQLNPNMFVLELFHGPTLAFKDFGARTMAAILSVFARRDGEKITIITATSGDTGAAVAHGFHKAPGVEVYILYPSGQVSSIQEKQFTTLGQNITALEVDGTFDDCQRLVKECFADEGIKFSKQLTTANSINIARLLPQMIYYIHATVGLMGAGASTGINNNNGNRILCSVPSGNFGNLTAGLLARKMGLPVSRFLAATNSNNVVPDFLNLGHFAPRASLRTISNAMDVGNPSNFARMLDLYQEDQKAMCRDITGVWYNDEQTSSAIREVWERYGYLMDPHTAVGYSGCRDHMRTGEYGLILATAHPAKFPETIEQLLPGILKTPERLQATAKLEKKALSISAHIDSLRQVLMEN